MSSYDIIKPRRPLAALVLSLACTGLGHIYCGRFAKGLALFFLSFAFVPVAGMAARFEPGAALFFMGATTLILVFALFAYAAVDAVFLARKSGPAYTLKDYNRWYVYLIFIVFSVGYPATYSDIIRNQVFQAFRIPSASMAPTILPGDFLALNKFIYAQKAPNRGDIIIFNHPNNRSRNYMKRIVALPGDTIEMRSGAVLVNDVPLEVEHPGEPAPVWAGKYSGRKVLERNNGTEYWTIADDSPGGNSPRTVVPNGVCFVLGDNRDDCEDSRDFGFIPLADVKGRAEYIYFPAETWRRLGPINYGSPTGDTR